MPLRIIFMGTPDFAVPTLRTLIDEGFDVVCVYTQPPRAAGRGQKPRPSPVHELAKAQNIEVRTPTSLKGVDEQAAFAALEADAAVVVAYGLILPKPILDATRLGCLNLHASKLPRWRGAAPIQRAIMAEDRSTAATAMLMDEGLDTGPILLEDPVDIGPETTAGELHDRLAAAGGPLMARALNGLNDGSLTPRLQPEDGATYARKIDKQEARIDWTQPASAVAAHINGLSPFPGAWFEADGQRVKVLKARTSGGTGHPGQVLNDSLTVACGDGAVTLLELQRAGKSAMTAGDFLRGLAIAADTVLN
jgi:methionyl-tRNA formyltransferase